jgi:parallel beta-helix repeat protein/predicted outer membrane repeat protein
MKTAIVLVAFLCTPLLSYSATIYVPDHYPTIQGAIIAAANGDNVVVKPGTYVENIDFLGKAITVTSELGPEVTIIDGNQSGSVVEFKNNEKPNSVLDGFTITNGSEYRGAGIYCKSSDPTLSNNIIKLNEASNNGGGLYIRDQGRPTVTNCIFEENSASTGGGLCNRKGSNVNVIDCTFIKNAAPFGGGISNAESSATITGCIFIGNRIAHGGGILNYFHSSLTVTECTFIENNAAHGGGIKNSENCSLTVIDCDFIKNEAAGGGGINNSSDCGFTVIDCDFIDNEAASGGGIENAGYSSASITGCTFMGNAASFGGGLFISKHCRARVVGCTFNGNQADKYGGGMHIDGSLVVVKDSIFEFNSAQSGGGINNTYARPELINCIFHRNSVMKDGGGMTNIESDPILVNCTFSRNTAGSSGGGISNQKNSDTSLTNCILWHDFPEEITNILGSSATVTYSCVEGGWPGAGNIDLDPRFVDEAKGDFHLKFYSPCRLAGDSYAVSELCDFEGDPRFRWDENTDMGADEFYNHLYCTGDFKPGGSIKATLLGVPGTRPVYLFFGAGILEPPAQTAWGNFHLMFPCMILNMAPICEDGVLCLPSILPMAPAPYDLFVQGLIGLEPDALTNVFVLEVR